MKETETTTLPELLTLADIAKLLQVSTRTVHRYRSEGSLCEPVLLAGRTPRWRRSDVLAWIADGCPGAAEFKQ